MHCAVCAKARQAAKAANKPMPIDLCFVMSSPFCLSAACIVPNRPLHNIPDYAKYNNSIGQCGNDYARRFPEARPTSDQNAPAKPTSWIWSRRGKTQGIKGDASSSGGQLRHDERSDTLTPQTVSPSQVPVSDETEYSSCGSPQESMRGCTGPQRRRRFQAESMIRPSPCVRR